MVNIVVSSRNTWLPSGQIFHSQPAGKSFFVERLMFICCNGIIVRRDLQQCESLSAGSKYPNASPRT